MSELEQRIQAIMESDEPYVTERIYTGFEVSRLMAGPPLETAAERIEREGRSA